MIDLFTFFTYIFLLAILTRLAYTKPKLPVKNFITDHRLNFKNIIGLIVISIIVGFRYEVGVDWQGYKDYFLYLNYYTALLGDQRYELGFFIINKAIIILGGSYVWVFFFSGLVSWYFLYKSVSPFLIPLFVFFLFVDEYFFWSMNGVRQFIAMSIFVFSIKSIIRKQFLYYLYFIILGSLFHTSILIMIPVYFLPFDKLYKRNIWIIIFILTFLFGSSNIILDIIDVIGKYTIFKSENIFSKYINYFQSEKIIFREIEYGLGFYFKVLINFMIILIADKVIKRDQNTTPYFILFF